MRLTIALVNDVPLYYDVQGQGVPIVFVHPPALSSVSFARQTEPLANEFQTITFDIRGHGKTPESEQPLTYRLIADDIKSLLDHLQIEKAWVCGYSTGGSVVLEFLLNHPHRALGGIGIGALSEVHDLRLRTRITLGVAVAAMSAVKPLALGISWSNSNGYPMCRVSYLDARHGSARNIKEYYQCSLSYNCTDQLHRIGHPILLVYGAEDTGFHSYAHQLHQRLQNSELVFIPGVKHQIPAKASRALNQLMTKFIQAQEGKVEEVKARESKVEIVAVHSDRS